MKKTKRSYSSNINLNNYNTKNQLNYNLDKNCLLSIKAQVINSKLVHGSGYNGDYVEYWIEIITDYKKWIIKKRYSEFYELNQKLIHKIPELNKLFPPKRFFKNSEDTIEERKNSFNKYLHFLFKNKNIFSLNEVLDFIKIEKKIVELYIKKHTMVKQDHDSFVFQSLKSSFNRMSLLEKMEKSKSVGESLNINGISSASTKINSKEDMYKGNELNINNINISILESCDSIYEIEESNTNYYSTLLEYEEIKNIKGKEDDKENFNNNYKRKGGTVVVEEFLKNLSQNIDNKIDIIKAFEEFLKQGEKWPQFSNTDIIKLYVGNINNSTINFDKKWSFCLNKLNFNKNNLNDNNLIKNEDNEQILYTRNSLKNLGNINNIINNKGFNDSEEDNIILKGLFYYIGDFDNNILLSLSCLNLLVKLLDNGFNPNVGIYLKIFKSRRISDYQTMKLEEIIKNNKGGVKATQNAFKLLSILFENRKNKDIIKKYLIKDETILKKLDIYISENYD